MAHVEVDKVHHLGFDEAMARLGPVQERLESRYGFTIVWTGNRAEAKGLGTSGYILVEDARIKVSLSLNLMLRPFAGKIQRMVEGALDDGIAGKLGDF